MDIYNYSQDGEYLGASTADPDPLEPDNWLIPALATIIKPPKTKAGKTAVFDGKAWALVDDYRGRSGWVGGVPTMISALGPLPDGWSDDSPPLPLPTLAAARAAKLTEITAGSNAAEAYAKQGYTAIEISSWPEQEAGARAILGDEANAKKTQAKLLLKSADTTADCVELVKSLALARGVDVEEFAMKICGHADVADLLTKQVWLGEQAGFERQLAEAVATNDVAAVQALVIIYSLPPMERADG